MDNFVPYHVLLKMIFLLDRCKCGICQSEKKKREDMLTKTKSEMHGK